MKNKRFLFIGLVILSLVALTSVALADSNKPRPGSTLVETVRQEAGRFQDVEAAESAGYGLSTAVSAGPRWEPWVSTL